MDLIPITPELVLRAYAAGIFPMAESRDDPTVHWIDPRLRGVLPIADFHVPRKLRKVLRRRPFAITCDAAFAEVIDACAQTGHHVGRTETWINEPIEDVFLALFEAGHAHSVEAWDDDGRLVGGLYGLALGGAFFGESMFSRASEASKVCLCHLVAILRRGGFTLLDTQFVNDHLVQFGVEEIPRAAYLERLGEALERPARFYCDGGGAVSALLGEAQDITQTS